MGKVPSLIRLHPWDVTNQAIHHVLEGVDVVIEDNDFDVGVGLANPLTLLNGGG